MRTAFVGGDAHTAAVASRLRVGSSSVLDLFLPLECGGCGTPSERWCHTCADAFRLQPIVVTARVDPGVPVLSLGRYAGSRRQAIVAMKDRGRRDLIPHLGEALSAGVEQLSRWQVIGTPLTLVPAPTRFSSARSRGGDPVTAICQVAAAGRSDVEVAPVLRMRGGARDSVGLSIGARQRNVRDRVVLRRPVAFAGELVLVDDVLTTGATAAESVRILRCGGQRVAAILVLTHA